MPIELLVALRRQSGFGAAVALIVLLVLSVLAAGMVALATGQNATAAQGALSARAWQAAKAGTEWAEYRVLKGDWAAGAASNPCPPAEGASGLVTANLDLTAVTGFSVAVSVRCTHYQEGTGSKNVYRIQSVACNAATCPAANAAAPGYVERTRVVITVR